MACMISAAFDPKALVRRLDLIRACHRDGKQAPWHPRLVVEEMSQLAHWHILNNEQTQLALEGRETGNERGKLRVPCHFLP